LDRKSLPPPATRSAIASEYEAPRTDLERRIAPLFSSVLGLRRVGRNEDFFALGGHSLLAAQLVFQIRDNFGVDVSLQSVFASPTVAGIAALLGGERTDGSSLDLPKEARLDAGIRALARPEAASADGRGVLLTGATGFVGAFLLRALLDQTDGTVRCLVRARSEADGRERLAKTLAAYRLPVTDLERMVPVVGDLSQPGLGLSPRELDALAADLGAIYHNGAAINFAFPYSAVKASNVGGTNETLKIAARADASFHYVSTLYVYGRDDSAREVITESTVPEDWKDLRMGYTQSKWVAERLVEQAQEQGVRTRIYRLGRICGSTATGAGPEHDLFWHVIRLGLQMGVVPDLDFPLDLTPVDFVATAIVRLAQSVQPMRHFHLRNPHNFNGRRVLEVLRTLGWKFDTVPIGRWGELLSEHRRSMSQTDPGYGIAGLLGGGDTLASALRFSTTRTEAALAARGLVCPHIDEELMERYLKYFVTVGHLQAPAGAHCLEPVC
jgi:thioester reductase-like protein